MLCTRYRKLLEIICTVKNQVLAVMNLILTLFILFTTINVQSTHSFFQYYQRTQYSLSGIVQEDFNKRFLKQEIKRKSGGYNGAIIFRDDDKLLEEGDSCQRSFDGKYGKCVLAYNCLHVIREFRKHGVKIDVCSYKKKIPIICCTLRDKQKREQTAKRASIEKCEEYYSVSEGSTLKSHISHPLQKCESSVPLIVGGENSFPGEYPHMAAIGWIKENSEINWACGGSLISKHYVLTAAHCSQMGGLPPDIVRLGKHNLVKNSDGAEPQDIKIAHIIKHPEYKTSSYYHDIALIKLDIAPRFSKLFRPACLWSYADITVDYGIATGWGRTLFLGNKSEELQKVELKIVDHKECSKYYRNERKLPKGIIDQQFCAGHLSGGKDTCQGDSGGPIHAKLNNKCIHYVIGITSFGKFCALPNSLGVYTKVYSYLNWIEQIAFNHD